MEEFSLIKHYFAPLATHPAARGLGSDTAVLRPAAGQDLVITTDTLIAGVHFMGNEDPALIARKSLRVNLSDLAAGGAAALGYQLALSLPRVTEESWVARFALGLKEDQQAFNIALLGGDTTATPGLLSITVTAFGNVPQGKALSRAGAKAGDLIVLSGTLGDAGLGLALLENRLKINPPPEEREYLLRRYRVPEPRMELGGALLEKASACMDVSDGLIQDMRHICQASGVCAMIEAEKLPLSPPARRAVKKDPTLLPALLSCGDDYELLFTLPPSRHNELSSLAKAAGVNLTPIGRTGKGRSVSVTSGGRRIAISKTGYRHFG